MVPSAPDAWSSRVVVTISGPVSSKIDLHRGNGIPRPRDKPPKLAFRPETVSAETETQPQEPANCGPLASLREIFRFERLRGGAGRTQTQSQIVMDRRLTAARPRNRGPNHTDGD